MDMDSGEFPFDFTNYYSNEMGPLLLRRFGAFENLVDPQILPQLKIKANNIEDEYARKDGSRQVNLDPGYIEQAKLILATTKNFSHRVYIGSGIYGEVTLQWHRGRFIPQPHTYPDYQDPFTLDFLGRVREKYRSQL